MRTSLMAAPAAVLLPGWAVGGEAPAFEPTDLGFLRSQLPFLGRDTWTRVAPRTWRMRAASLEQYNRITVHHDGCVVNKHTSLDEVARDLDGILGGHLKRNFGDIGYHFAVDYAGRVWEARSLSYWGAHVSGHNEDNIGIVLLGNFEEQTPSTDQLDALNQLVVLLRQHFDISRGRVYGHIELGRTLCPGRYLYPSVADLKRA